ncbi:restriction endonuclease subunit S [Pseudomonas palleroniana]|uniref:Restriction endonuclease subunit S n=1 Tax=Pseudomonas palleroniana TaxID=191390 RepID=A0A2L1JDF3_9PSED|nr:restriction endonuclease subunit S [Pseudomonas palleroniana]AVE06488.1 restriction endonuclease subunit S [Pseudomonas palleroniana]
MASESDWKEASLGDIIELKRGYDLPKDKRTTGCFPIVSSAGVSDFHSVAMVKGPGVITGRYGTIGEVFYTSEDYWPLNTTLYVRDFKGNDPRFISYFLKTLDFDSYSDKGAVPGVNRNHLHLAKVCIPGIETQKAIAKVLSGLDSKINLNQRINQTLETMAQVIFKSWFVDFDPVKAKIAAIQEGTDPLRAAMSAISGKPDAELEALPLEQYEQLAAIASMFPDEMDESAMMDIPKGWAIQSADSLTEVGIGKTPPRKEPQWFTEGQGDWRWVSIRDMGASGVFQQRASEYLTSEAVGRFNVRVVPDRTVLLSFKLTIGRVAITDGPMVTNEAIAHFKLPNETAVSSEYLYLYLKGFDFSTLGSTSSIADAVNSKTIREMPITVASRDLIDRFTKSVAPLFEEIRNRQKEISSLGATSDALLPKLLSGEIEVST